MRKDGAAYFAGSMHWTVSRISSVLLAGPTSNVALGMALPPMLGKGHFTGQVTSQFALHLLPSRLPLGNRCGPLSEFDSRRRSVLEYKESVGIA